ncbi:MAG: hypothetical protein WCG47_33840 [Dermatophilaceae bacterium]
MAGGSGLDGRLRRLNSGAVSTPSGQVTQTLAGFVERVLDRLTDLGVVNTPLQQEWDAIRTMSLDEIDFAKAAGRLGLDPFDVDADLVDAILRAGKELPDALLEEFLDSVDPEAIGAAHNWLSTARTRAGPPQPWQPPDLDLGDSAESGLLPSAGRPWEAGFRLAREVRSRLQVSRDQAFPIHDLVEDLTVDEPAGGLRGLVVARTTRPRIVMPRPYPSATVRFAQAQALGLLLLGAGRTEFVVSPAHTLLASAARSFAAELLVPADAIRDRIPRGPADERFFEVIGAEFGASPFVAQHQYDNQVIGARDVVGD